MIVVCDALDCEQLAGEMQVVARLRDGGLKDLLTVPAIQEDDPELQVCPS
jgi:hypothetical protein